ncbi:unnamed protein product [Heterobilharzia americana]|nr:unnamed protein product [Heterobilharzia americana]
MVSENENATSPYDHQASNLSDPLSKTSHSVINKSSLLRESKNDLHKKRKDGKYQNSSYKDDPVNLDESQSKLSCRDSHNRRLKRNSDHRSVDREKSLNSRTKSTADGTPPSRKRSRSHVSSSYHSSVSRSRYSSRTESSHKYDRHKRSYLKSKSYSSRSSARTSRSFRSSYSSRSRSSSARTPRRRRHLRSFYRRRHRRRSYSIRSRSRSRSWRSTDSSFSSRSSHSSRSRFSRRDTSKNRSSSRRSRTPLYRPISSITKASDDYTRTSPEHRLTRLGVGSVSKETTSDGKVNSPYNESKSISYIPSVNETVSAAVKRVVGGGQSKNQKSLRESASTKKSDNNIGSNPVNNLKLSDENNGDSRSQPLSSSILAESDSKISSPSVLVDIPLPQDALHQSSDNLDNKNHLNKSVPYIGPQVPPELAKRFGLSVADNVIKSDASDCVTSIPSDRYTVTSSEAAQPRNNSNSFCDTMSTSEFTIPPEQAELYRPLQEQAKEHALRRSSILMSEELKLSRNTNEFQLLQQQHVQRQLALLQQHQQQQNQSTMVFAPASVIYSTPSFLPFYATSTPLLSTVSSGSITAASNAAITEASIPQHVAAEAMLLRQQQQQQFSALCGAAYPQQVSCSDASQMLLGSVSNPHNSSGLSVEQPTTSSSFPSSVKQEGNPLSTSIQQAQLRQLIAAAALQSATQGSNNNIFPSQNTVQSITQQQLLSQLIAQQSQLSGVNIAPNLVTASLLAAQQQQKQLIAQWQKHALALAAAGSANDQFKNIQERRLSTITPGNAFTNSAVSASNNLASILNASNSLPAAVQLGLLRSNLTASVLPNTGLNTPTQNQVASVAALIAAAQQQQQQQQQYQQATVVSSAQQSLAANPSLFPVSSANQEFSHAVQSALLPQQLQQRFLQKAGIKIKIYGVDSKLLCT